MNVKKNYSDVDNLMEQIRMDFKVEDLPFCLETTEEFVARLLVSGKIDESEIYSFLKEYSETNFGNNYCARIYIRDCEDVEKYPRIFFWGNCLHCSFRIQNDSSYQIMHKLFDNIEIVAEDIVEKERDALIKDIREYVNAKKQNSDNFDCFFSFIIYKDSNENVGFWNKYYPRELLEEIKKIVPDNFLYLFQERQYESLPLSNEQEKSGDESNSEPETVWTKKEFYDKWNELINREQDNLKPEYKEYEGGRGELRITEVPRGNAYYYRNIITKWGKLFPIKLLRKEIERKNTDCIVGALYSYNEYAIRTIFAYIYNGTIELQPHDRRYISKNDHVIFWENDEDYHYGDLIATGYCKLLVVLSINTRYINEHENLLYWLKPERLMDILDIIDNNPIIGEKMKKTLETAGIDLFHKLTYEEHCHVRELEKRSYAHNEELIKISNGKISAWDLRDKKNEFDLEIDKIVRRGKTPYELSVVYDNSIRDDLLLRPRASIRFWLFEHKDIIDMLDYDDELTTFGYKRLREFTLEKPFFFPKNTPKNRELMANYFYRELPFSDFQLQEQNSFLKEDILWKRYWQNFIEDAYKKFEQPRFETPLLPIIPEYADYLLSRTNGIFSTAIKNLVYEEFTVFLLENRKIQIKKLLKNNILSKEEANKLTELAESSDSNYYAWSNVEIKGCLSPDIDQNKMQRLHAELEPEFMVRIFEKSIFWILNHKDSELWLTAPWFGMQIFNKSYKDRPSVWANHLVKIATEWGGNEDMLVRICFALGHLREPLGGKTPIALRNIASKQKDEKCKGLIIKQANLFNGENFNKGHHRNPVIRVKECKDELIRGQNAEV